MDSNTLCDSERHHSAPIAFRYGYNTGVKSEVIPAPIGLHRSTTILAEEFDPFSREVYYCTTLLDNIKNVAKENTYRNALSIISSPIVSPIGNNNISSTSRRPPPTENISNVNYDEYGIKFGTIEEFYTTVYSK